MSAQQLDRRSPLPLWAQLQADLQERLTAGEFDAEFPGELALVEAYGVSRYTVRSALRALREEGLVVAERGRAPRVADRTEIEQPLGALYSLFASVQAAGLEQRSIVRVLDIRADGVAAAHLDLDGSTPLLYLERLRLAGDAPLALDRVWLPAAIAGPLLDADFGHTSLYAELAARTGVRVDAGEEQVRAVVPSPAERALLEIDPSIAAFSISRVGRAGRRPVERRHTLVRGDRFSVTAAFSSRRGNRLDVATRLPRARMAGA
ncbi:GntR family transcriptional regulator [Pseudonocardia acidicola]|uniref:GntR family transcriptional regulator n=1 Tax=Pseudonocardia acidicola TaxID=2724939 RepID=A0ABX1S3M9_9PSEU|nr:GntR family transcriptional regulator [Pseudonocardia acidicola]NMH96186.1 GntR family transcriptional regulator [Pseudonocardia acidicola]